MARRTSSLFPSKNTPKTPPPDMINAGGYEAWSGSLEEDYLQTLMTNILGNTYYADTKKNMQMSADLHNKMAAKDPVFMAKALVYARQKGFMRTNPIFGLAVLSKVPGPYFEQAFGGVIRTPNDLSDFFQMLATVRTGQGGRKVKRVAGKWLMAHLTEYWAIKYGADREGGFSIKDILQVTHPKGQPSLIVDWIFDRKVKAMKKNVPQIAYFEELKNAKTAEDKIEAITLGKLPHEVATSFAGKDKAVWEAIVPQMPIFALLKNLATLERHGVMDSQRKHVISVLTNPEQVQKSKILPFRFIEAEKHVNDAKIKDALRDAVDLSFDNVPDIAGVTDIALDISGSMNQYIQTASVFALALMKKSKGEGNLWLFDTSLEQFKFSMRDSILTQSQKIRARGGTDQGLVLRRLIKDKRKVDNLIYITDEQQNAGTPLYKLIAEYRKTVNKNVKVFIIDLAPYLNHMTPTTEKNTWYIYGWSDQVLNVISLASEGLGSQIAQIMKLNNPEA